MDSQKPSRDAASEQQHAQNQAEQTEAGASDIAADSGVELALSAELEDSTAIEAGLAAEAEADSGGEREASVEVDTEADVGAEVQVGNDENIEAGAEVGKDSAEPAVEADPEPDAKDEAQLLREQRPWLKSYPLDVAPSLYYPDVNIAQFLLDAAKKYPKHNALYFMGKTMTYQELHKAAVRLAQNLIASGIKQGDRVAIMLPNCPQAVTAYYGVLLAGAIVVQTNPLYVERELLFQLQDSEASAIIVLDMLYPRLHKIRGSDAEENRLPKLKHVIVTSIKDGLPFPKNLLYPIKQRKEGFKAKIPYGSHGVVAYRRWIADRTVSSVELPELVYGNELAALQYTGGTTGKPKGVMLTHRNLVSNTIQTSAWCYRMKFGEEKYLAALPLFHVFGLTVLMNMSVYSGGMLILLPRFEIDKVLETIESMKPTIFPGAPTMYVGLIHHDKASHLDLSSIEVCISGSAALPLEVQEQFEKLTGGRLIEGYGLTEASPVTHANPIWGRRKTGTIGVPFPDTDAAIFDPITDERLPAGEIGELVIRGPQVMAGYWNREEESKAVLRNGWLHTGDLATMDEDGYFTIIDRIKDVIIAGGFNIYPREVEEVLFEHPAVKEVSVIGISDVYRGETVKAFIVLKAGCKVSVEQLNIWCRERLAAYKVPHKYEYRDSLPKTMVGKVLRRQLVEEELQKTASQANNKE